MDLNKLRVFHSVAKMGGLNEASAELKMSKSSISLAVSKLEKNLGKSLFTRHYRGMQLTKDGEILYCSTNIIFSEVDNIFTTLQTDQKSLSGLIRLSTTNGISSSHWFTDKIKIITKKYPDIHIKIIDYKEGETSEDEADVFICPYIYDNGKIIQEKIKTYVFHCYASQSYINNNKKPETINDLDNHRLLAFSQTLKNPFNDVDSLLHLGRSKQNPRDIFMQVTNSISLLELVVKGVGIAVLDEDECVGKGLVKLFGEAECVKKESYFTFKKNVKSSYIINELKKCFLS